ncbi:GntR family transcriptional regulator [Thioclava sp. FTW29]|uniref:GntR family transcriptional regulator n=1 Tax=Thioclava litoralis TaxID=3076557 RepID=A0ABZ1E2Z9_9RHOB|nr:GntR family transcriptional regulator [Thioclava sp. FTW29]
MSYQPTTKSDTIAQQLSTRIIRGEFAPGEKLRQDLIAREYGVSQVTAREALLRLASQGLAISLPRRGMCVTPIDKDAIEELRLMRHALEPLALERSVPYLNPAQIAEIEHLHEACNAAATAEDWEEANRGFHMAIIAGCHMPRLVSEISNLQLLYARHFKARYSDKWRRRDDPDHAAILSAIKARDAARARTVMQRHLMRFS